MCLLVAALAKHDDKRPRSNLNRVASSAAHEAILYGLNISANLHAGIHYSTVAGPRCPTTPVDTSVWIQRARLCPLVNEWVVESPLLTSITTKLDAVGLNEKTTICMFNGKVPGDFQDGPVIENILPLNRLRPDNFSRAVTTIQRAVEGLAKRNRRKHRTQHGDKKRLYEHLPPNDALELGQLGFFPTARLPLFS